METDKIFCECLTGDGEGFLLQMDFSAMVIDHEENLKGYSLTRQPVQAASVGWLKPTKAMLFAAAGCVLALLPQQAVFYFFSCAAPA